MTAMTLNEFKLPNGVTLIDTSKFYTSTVAPNDTFTERWVIDMCGMRFQILRYDSDKSLKKANENILVWWKNEDGNQRGRFMHKNEVGKYILEIIS